MKKALFVCLLSALVGLTTYAGPERGSKHIVKQGETLYSISKTYGVKLKDLLQANPALTAKSNIKPGLKITIPGKATVHSETGIQASNHKPKTTVIVPSTPDTPYKDEDNKTRTIAPVSTENILAVNTDQPVINTTASSPYSLRTTATTSSDYPGVFSQYTAHGYKLNKARGAANFLDDNTSGNPYLALYSNAETGSVIKVTNLMNKKSVYVKVVGRVPAIDAGKEVILKLSNKVAQELGALDAKFLVEVASVQAN
jgi:LysM repeat protein